MEIDTVFTRPDGTPIAEDEIPAQGTLLVIEVTSAPDWSNAMEVKVLGWVPGADEMARNLLGGACRALNKRDDPVPPDDQEASDEG